MGICCCVVILLMVLGCHQSHAGGTQKQAVPTDSCYMQLYPDTWIDTVLTHPKLARTPWDDECVLATIDSLEVRLLMGKCQKCIEAFNAVVISSDGYVGEAVVGVVGRLYYSSFEDLVQFLSGPHNSAKLFDCIAYSFFYEISADAAPEQRREEIIRDIQLKMLGRTTPEKKLLERLIQKVREIKAD